MISLRLLDHIVLLACLPIASHADVSKACDVTDLVAQAGRRGEALLQVGTPELIPGAPGSEPLPGTSGLTEGIVAGIEPPAEMSTPEQAVDDTVPLAELTSRQLEKGGGGKKSVFALTVDEIDSYLFWEIMGGMLVFTIIIDRSQAYVDYLVRDSESGQMLVNRIYGEFVMFGVVAITIFIGNNLVKISDTRFAQLEYMDILCSLACCTLIVIVATLFSATTAYNKRFLHFELETIDPQMPLSGTEFGAPEYQAIAKRFRQTHKLPDNFVFSVYLKECFVRDCCDVMNVGWITWSVMAGIAVLMYFLKITFMEGVMPVDTYLMRILSVNLGIFVAHAGVAIYVYRVYATFVADIPRLAVEDSTEPLNHPQSEHFGHVVRRVLQFISIANTFMFGQFLMNLIHVVNVNDVGSVWYALLIAPLMVNMLVCLPAITKWLALVEAFYGSNAEALDAVITQMNRLDEDMRYVRLLWKHKGEPEISGSLDTKFDLPEFTKALEKDLELHVSEDRARRLFKMFDDNGDGTVTAREFMEALKSNVKITAEKLAAAQDLG
jgi:hypothetical protein